MTLVEFRGSGGMTPGYLSMPDGEGPFPGVVVIQEWWGLNRQIRGVADKLAAAGFAALVPDLYHGKTAEEPDEAKKLLMAMQFPQALQDIQGAIEYLVARPDVQPKKAGVIGFCMGGGIAGTMAFTGKDVAATVVFYGKPPFDQMNHVAAPILAIFGEEDKSTPPEVIGELRRRLADQGDEHEIVVYPGANHAFANEEGHSYNPEAAADAWKRAQDWLKRFVHYP